MFFKNMLKYGNNINILLKGVIFSQKIHLKRKGFFYLW